MRGGETTKENKREQQGKQIERGEVDEAKKKKQNDGENRTQRKRGKKEK